MDVRQLEYVVAVAEELNFTRAAARCHVAQSALSYQVARLERKHGVTLFERTSRSVRLAPAGELLLPRARAVLAGIEAARVELAELAGVVTGRLRIGMIGSTGQAAPVVERALAAFHHRHPGVEIAIRDTGSRHMAGQVRDGELDVAFVGLHPGQLPAGLTHRVLADEPLVLAVPHGHPDSGLADLATRSAFVEMRAESGLRRQVDAVFARAGLTRRIAFELATSDAVARFVAHGFGPAVVPRSAVEARPGDVSALDLADPDARHPIVLVHRGPAPSAPGARAFLAVLDEFEARAPVRAPRS
ncbi:LysR family transcriptional regulator [Pseudonocardia sp.]|uniref:LysR family transcriptional regulator n=1 Tax=Pseudonocardia sp. TaxID=60912 RepID=UPI003D09E98E